MARRVSSNRGSTLDRLEKIENVLGKTLGGMKATVDKLNETVGKANDNATNVGKLQHLTQDTENALGKRLDEVDSRLDTLNQLGMKQLNALEAWKARPWWKRFLGLA